MIKRNSLFVAVVLSCLLSSPAIAAVVPPTPIPSATEGGVFLRLFKDIPDATLMAETGGINESDGRNYSEVTLGAYHDVLPRLTVGAFYRRAYGLRHDNDWQNPNGTWEWADTGARGEDFLILDATPRLMVQGLPVEHMTIELKTRLLQNFFNGEQTLMLRPGATFFWLKNEQAFINIFLQYEMDFGLNYGHHPINEHWLYLGGLYRVTSDIDVGGFFAEKWQAWDNASAYNNKGGSPYTLTATSDVLCALVIWHL